MIFLKIRDRGSYNNQVLENIKYWQKVFEKFGQTIVIVNDGCIAYTGPHITLDHLKAASPIMVNRIEHYPFSSNWKRAAFALLLPYFYSNDPVTINIDADDMFFEPNDPEKIGQILFKVMAHLDINPTLSFDMHLSHHVKFAYFKPHHWSFGINFSNTYQMRNIINAAMDETYTEPPWGTNADYILDQFLEKTLYPYIAFSFPNFVLNHGHATYYALLKNTHPRTLIL